MWAQKHIWEIRHTEVCLLAMHFVTTQSPWNCTSRAECVTGSENHRNKFCTKILILHKLPCQVFAGKKNKKGFISTDRFALPILVGYNQMLIHTTEIIMDLPWGVSTRVFFLLFKHYHHPLTYLCMLTDSAPLVVAI